MPHASQSGWTARAHGDTMHRQFTVFRDQHWREIFDAHARSAGGDDDICISLKGFDNGVAIVADKAGKVNDAPVTFFNGETADRAQIEPEPPSPESASIDSAGSTASAPRGIGAPVITRTASPAATEPSNGQPGIESPITFNGSLL